jgi:hypothetical protein
MGVRRKFGAVRSSRVAAAQSRVSAKRGRPPRMVFINVKVRASTREGLNTLVKSCGATGQGEVLDLLVAKALGR